MVSLKELQHWHLDSAADIFDQVESYSEYLRVYMEMFDEWIETGNNEFFLEAINAWNLFMEGYYVHQYLLVSEKKTLAYYQDYGIICEEIGKTSEEYARHTWKHERAHKDMASRWGIRSAARLTWILASDGCFVQPWLHMNVTDLKKVAHDGHLFSAMGEILLAPSNVGVGYEREENLAKRVLAAARKREVVARFDYFPWARR